MPSPHRSMPIPALIVTAVLCCITMGSAVALPLYFRYTSIADTSEHFFKHVNFPCINNLSRIAFTGTLSSGVEGVFSRVNLGGFNTLADSGSTEYQAFGLDCSINHNGMIEFSALKKTSDGFDTVILRGTGNSSLPLIDSTGSYDEFRSFQLNTGGKSVLGTRRASDNTNVILVKGQGTVTGPERVVVPGNGAVAQYSSFSRSPSINSAGKIAVAARDRNQKIHILTIDESNLVTQLLNDDGPFVGVGNVTINNSSSILFAGVVAGGERGVWRLDPVNGSWYLTQLASSNNTVCDIFDATALSDLGVAVFACRDFNSFTHVFMSDQHGLHKMLGLGSVILGRRVLSANIGREAINSDKNVALLVNFDDGSSAIVRASPTYLPDWLVTDFSNAFQLEVSSDGGTSGITTPINVRPKLMLLSFDVTFPNKGSGELRVMLGDKLLKSFAATLPGIEQHFVVPIDLRKESRIANVAVDQLRFEFSGKAGAAAQISNVVIPGVISDSMQADTAKRWHIDASKGGYATVVDTTAFPVKVQLMTDGKPASLKSRVVPVAIFSSDGFDATQDIDLNSLTFNGALLSPETKIDVKQKGATSPRCTTRDVDADKLPDLVCDVPLGAASKTAKNQMVRVDATSIHGWRIAGSSETNTVE